MSNISGYSTCFEASARGQDIELSLESFLAVCDEVIVVDCNDPNGSDDSSARLRAYAEQQSRLRIVDAPVVGETAAAAYALAFTAPGIARAECTGATLLQFELDQVADTDRIDELRALATRLEFEDPRVGGYALPYASYCDGVEIIDAARPSRECLTRNDPRFVHDIPRAYRRFDEDGSIRAVAGAHEGSLVRSDTLEAVTFRSTFDPRVESWVEQAQGVDVNAILARDQLQDELNEALERGPAIFSTTFLDRDRSVNWQRDRFAPLLAMLFVADPGKTCEESGADLTPVLCGRVPPAALLVASSAREGATAQ